MAYRNFYDLDVWKKARCLKLSVYGALKHFPDKERFELASQLMRAVRSIATNISEGHGRQSEKDELRFCTMARGSHSETLNHLIDAYDCGYLSEEELRNLKIQWDEVGRLLNGYMSFLRSRISGSNDSPGKVQEDEQLYINAIDSEYEKDEFFSILDRK